MLIGNNLMQLDAFNNEMNMLQHGNVQLIIAEFDGGSTWVQLLFI